MQSSELRIRLGLRDGRAEPNLANGILLGLGADLAERMISLGRLRIWRLAAGGVTRRNLVPHRSGS